MLLDIAHEDVVDVLLRLLFRALRQELRVVDFHGIDATLEDADISQWLPYNSLLLLDHIAGADEIRAKRVALILATADQHDQTFGILALIGV